jgi:hypothetical protein
MTNIALILLSLTLGAESPTEASPPTTPAAETTPEPSKAEAPAEPEQAPTQETTPAPAPEATPAPIPQPASTPLVKPSENDIEVLSEVVDLQETQDPTAGWYGKGFPEPIRILALPTARVVRKGRFDFVIDHRSSTAIYDKDSKQPFTDMWNNFLGFDSPIQVGLGLRYGVIDNLDVGLYRAGKSVGTDTYEFDARYQALQQEKMGIDLAARAGATWFSQPKVEDSHGFFGQLLATRLIVNRILISAGALYHSNSTNDYKYNQAKKWSTAGALGVEARIAAPVAVDAEIVTCVAGYCSKRPAFSAGVKYFTNRHTFALVCGNTQYITADGYLTNTDRLWSKLVIGFNITREY